MALGGATSNVSSSANGGGSFAVGGTTSDGHAGGSPSTTGYGGQSTTGGSLGISTGGALASGGVKALGGTLATGGPDAAGSSQPKGGSPSTSDTTTIGGTLATGGSSTTGAVPVAGGSSTTGGVAATGGVYPTGGVSTAGYSSSIGGNTSIGTGGSAGTSSIQCPFVVSGVPSSTACNVALGTPCTLSGNLTENSTGAKIGTYLYSCTCTAGAMGNTWVCMSGPLVECPLATLDNPGASCDSTTNDSCSMIFTVSQGLTTETDCSCTKDVSSSSWACTAGTSNVACPAAVGIDPTGVPCRDGMDSNCSRVYNYGPTATKYNCTCTVGTSSSTWVCSS